MSTTQVEQIAVADLHVDGNPRKSIDEEQLKQLVASIEHNGILEPLRVTKNDQGYRIESGQRRWTAALAAGLEFVPCVIVTHEDAADEKVKAIVTNVQREDMNPVDEARAYERLAIEHGLTVSGIAEKVGVPKMRVTTRLELLELPEAIVEHYRAERLPLSARTSLLAMSKVSTHLAEQVAKACLDKPDWGEVLAKNPGQAAEWVAKDDKLGKKLIHVGARILYIDWQGSVRENPLELSDEQLAALLPDAKDRGSLYLHWDDEALDSLNAGGVLYRGKGGDHGVITDVPYAKDAALLVIERYTEGRKRELEKRAKEKAKELVKNGEAGEAQADEAAEALKDFRRQLREAHEAGRAKARAANADLGTALLQKAAKVDVGQMSMELARTLVGAALGDSATTVFQRGLRYCLPQYEIREESKTKAGATRVKVTYKGQTQADAAKLVVEFLDGAKTPGELVGRAVVLLVAAQYADQGVLPQSQQTGGQLRSSSLAYSGAKQLQLHLDKLVDKSLVPAALRARVAPSEKERQALMDANPELAAKVNANQTR